MAREDPLGAYNFKLTLLDSSTVVDVVLSFAGGYQVAGFSECSGLDASVEVIEYREGGLNEYVRKFPSRASFSNITMRRGVVYRYDELWNWHNDFVQGKGKRKDGLIVLQDSTGRGLKIWKFRRGVPLKWSGPALNATSNAVALESLEISHEGLLFESP